MESVHHQTAGGVVFDQGGRLLTLVRDIEREGTMRHEVRLPKGHVDPGESEQDAAVREVCEESGYCAAEVLADLGTMTSEYDFRGRHHVRSEHYYLMRADAAARQPPAPMGPEEALFEVQWLTGEAAPAALTYPSEQEFARRALAAWRALEPTP